MGGVMNGGTNVAYNFLSGSIFLLSWVIALFFLKFWTKTQDKLFAYFSLAFAILGVERLALAFLHVSDERQPLIYILRLIAFSAIILAIVQKNREGRARD